MCCMHELLALATVSHGLRFHWEKRVAHFSFPFIFWGKFIRHAVFISLVPKPTCAVSLQHREPGDEVSFLSNKERGESVVGWL